MKIAVLSDTHGNYYAFKACLEVAFERNIDTFIFLGDYLGEFAYPKRTIKLLYELKEKYNCCFIRGNKEDYWLNMQQGVNCEWKDGNSSIYAMLYNYSNLSKEDLDFFSQMKICDCLKMDNLPSITYCHGSLRDNKEKLMIINDERADLIKKCESDYILCGHSHIQQYMDVEGKTVINPGAVGVAQHSENGKSQFMILTSEENGWNHEFISVDYDKERTIKDLHESGLYEKTPYWCQITEHLINTGEVSHGTVLNEAYKLCHEEIPDCEWYNIPDKYWEKALEVICI